MIRRKFHSFNVGFDGLTLVALLYSAMFSVGQI